MVKFKAGDTLQQRYRIIKLLGKGGFGAVYLAEHVRLQGRRLALKVSFDNSPEAERQFLFEASTLANLHHPGLPVVSDSFVENGDQLFLVMDYVEGEDLTDVIIQRRGPVSEREAVDWMVQICEAVAYLHEQPKPIIHRDIKPPNIKLTPEGRAVLVDFGIAKQFTPGERTAKIAKAFSPGFSPHEQYIGTTDARTDVYALGATLYCLLTAEVPPDAFQDRLAAEIPLTPLRKINPKVSPIVEQVVMKAMAMQAQYRYADARQMVDVLHSIMGQGGAAASGLRCPQCGYINRAGIRFCVRDGARLNSFSLRSVSVPRPVQALHKKPVAAATSAHQHNAQGLKFSKAGQITQAMQAYGQAVRLDPQNAVYHHNLALAYLRDGNSSYALREALLAESLDPHDADFASLVGRSYSAQKQFSRALAAYQRALNLTPQDANLYSEMADIYLEQEEPLSALEALARASQLDGKNPFYLLRMAQIFYTADMYGESRELVEAAVKLAPDLGVAHNFLGMILYASGAYSEAIRAQEQALRLEPDDAIYALNIALGYHAIGHKRKARQMVKQALALDSGNVAARELLQKL